MHVQLRIGPCLLTSLLPIRMPENGKMVNRTWGVVFCRLLAVPHDDYPEMLEATHTDGFFCFQPYGWRKYLLLVLFLFGVLSATFIVIAFLFRDTIWPRWRS
ncbi:hypothetical protein QR680_010431 [Steinernema hermaphroditum]|uniref:Uncharacterized protein n=1 Tax=Steinernema hermaphroditum TaxID=289476 RepID=A0AA39IQJ0_9BILA|nr:hypothetical protein QR680_010431 [Steinernema hermaphroditum]